MILRFFKWLTVASVARARDSNAIRIVAKLIEKSIRQTRREKPPVRYWARGLNSWLKKKKKKKNRTIYIYTWIQTNGIDNHDDELQWKTRGHNYAGLVMILFFVRKPKKKKEHNSYRYFVDGFDRQSWITANDGAEGHRKSLLLVDVFFLFRAKNSFFNRERHVVRGGENCCGFRPPPNFVNHTRTFEPNLTF